MLTLWHEEGLSELEEVPVWESVIYRETVVPKGGGSRVGKRPTCKADATELHCRAHKTRGNGSSAWVGSPGNFGKWQIWYQNQL